MVAPRRFDQTDRRAVIRKVEEVCGVSLKPAGRRRKWLRDEVGRSYWVLGGYGEWHGIPEEMMDAEVGMPTGGLLVIAMRGESAMQIYVGPLEPLARDRTKLYRASTTGDYQFTYKKRGAKIIIDQVPSAILSDLAGFEYTKDMKASDRRIEEAWKLIESMTEEERREFLEWRQQHRKN